MNLKLNWQKLDYLWLTLAIIASVILSYGIFTNWLFSLLLLLVLGILLLLINDFEIGALLILLSIIPGQLARIGVAEYGGSIIASDLIVILVVGTWLVKKLIKREKMPKTPLNLPLSFFIIFAIISLLFSLNFIIPVEFLKASLYLVRFSAYVAIFYLVLDFARDKKKAIKYWQWIVATGIIVAVLGFIQLFYVPDFAFMAQFGWDPHEGRLLSTFFDPNLLGGFLAFILTMILGVSFFSDLKRDKYWLFLAGLILFLALVLTFSRSAYLAFLVSFVVVTMIRSWKIALLGLVLAALLFLAFPRSIERIQGALTIDVTAQARIASWKRGWEIISDRPFIGVGFNTLPYIKPAYGFLEEDTLAHSAAGIDSSLLTIWVTSGIVGLILYLAIYGIITWQAFRTYLDKNQSRFIRGFGLGLGAALVGLLVHSQFVNSLLYPPVMILIWFCAGILFSFLNQPSKLLIKAKK